MTRLDFGHENNRTIAAQNDWLNSDGPLIVVSGDLGVRDTQLNATKRCIDDFLDELDFTIGNDAYKLNVKSTVDYSAKTENSDLIGLTYELEDRAESLPFDEHTRVIAQGLVKLQNNTNGYSPHLDVILTSKSLGDGYGVTYPGTIFLNNNNLSKRLVQHELGHALGVNPDRDGHGNCDEPDCLMTYNLSGDKPCPSCYDEIAQNLREKMIDTDKYFLK